MCDADPSVQNTTSSLSLLDLPVEILLHICSFLDAATLVHNLSIVCKELNVIVNDNSAWKARISHIWPHSGFPVLSPAEEDDLFWKLSCVSIERQCMLWGKDSGEMMMEKLSLSNVHYGTIDSVLLLNEAKICVSGARDRSLVYWVFPNEENSTNLSKVNIDAHDGWIWDLTALYDTVYSCSWDRTIKAWKLTDAGLVASRTYQMYMATGLVIFHSVVEEKAKRERNAMEYSVRLYFHVEVAGALLCMTSCPDLGLFAAGSFCKTVLVFDPRSDDSLIHKYQPHQRAIVTIAMNTNYILSASEDKTVSIWDQRARKTMKTIKVSDNSFPMSISVQKGIVYVGDNGGKLHVLDPRRDFELVKSYTTGHKKAISGVKCAPGCLITGSLDKTVRITSPTNPPQPLATLESTYGEVASMDYMNEVLAISGTDGIEIWRPKNRA